MKACCICGKETENEGGIVLTGERVGTVCRECEALLDDINAGDRKPDGAKEAYRAIQDKMRASHAPAIVLDAVESIYKDCKAQSAGAAIREAERSEEAAEETPKGSVSRGYELIKLAGNVDGAMLIFTILSVIASIVCGIIVGQSLPGTGWTIAIYGVILPIMAYVFIHLILRVAQEIGRISDSTQETNRQLTRLVQHLVKKGK